jgi:hypothetical protein
MPQLTLAKELMTNLVADEESFGESGKCAVLFVCCFPHGRVVTRLLFGNIRGSCTSHI